MKSGFLAGLKTYLTPEEVARADSWLRLLTPADQKGIPEFLRITHGCVARNSKTGNYYAMSAVGSTLLGKGGYRDIDFLLLSGSDLDEIGDLALDGQGLAAALRSKYRVRKPDDVVKDAVRYAELYNCGESGRDLLTITPVEGMESPCKKIHLILQPHIASESDWDARDKYERVPLFRIRRK